MQEYIFYHCSIPRCFKVAANDRVFAKAWNCCLSSPELMLNKQLKVQVNRICRAKFRPPRCSTVAIYSPLIFRPPSFCKYFCCVLVLFLKCQVLFQTVLKFQSTCKS